MKLKVKTKPYAHQLQAIKKLYDKPGIALFMEQGTGKTKTVIDLAVQYFNEERIEAVMVIAPNGVQLQWAESQIPEHCAAPYETFVWSTAKTKRNEKALADFFKPSNKLKFFCINVETFSSNNHLDVFIKFLKTFETFTVVDESTRIKNPKAKRTENIVYGLAHLKKMGRRVVEVLPLSDFRAVLTGTMVTNSPYDLWSMFEFLHHNFFKCDYFSFRARYGIEIKDTNPGTGKTFSRPVKPSEIQSVHRYAAAGKLPETIAAIMGMTEASVLYLIHHPNLLAPYKRLDELKAMIDPISFIVRKEDCLDLPPKVYETLLVEMSPDQKRMYKELRDQYITEYGDAILTVQNAISLIGRLQQITGGFFPSVDGEPVKPIGNTNPKISYLIRDLEETGDEKIIVWARFVAELKAIHKELTRAYPEKRIALYYGGVSREERNTIIKAFQKGEVDILVANAATAGMGLNLQAAHLQYFFSNTYSLEDREQAEDRSHRAGQKHSVLYKDIIIKGTVDEAVLRILRTKKNLLDYFRDNSLIEFLG